MLYGIKQAVTIEQLLKFSSIGSIVAGLNDVEVACHDLLESGIEQPQVLGFQ